MEDAERGKTGRTYADALVEIFSTWKLFTLGFGAIAMLLATLHFSAEPGSQIELFGIKYQKAKAASPRAQTAATDETSTYLYPKSVQLDLKKSVAIPILDGTIAVKPKGYELQLVGDSISELTVGARAIDGTPSDYLYKEDNRSATFGKDMHIELGFRNRYFAMQVRESDPYKSVEVTVLQIARPTLKLKKIADLKGPASD